MRMTDEQIRVTVAGMDMSQTLKDALLKQAIADNNPGARFVIAARARRSATTSSVATADATESN